MSAGTDGIVSWTCTRIQLIDALAALPLGGYLTLEARGRFADCITAQLPEASPERSQRAFDAGAFLATQAERERLINLADERNATYVVECRRTDCDHPTHQRGFAELIEDSAEFGPQP